jgi:hypothetical protein
LRKGGNFHSHLSFAAVLRPKIIMNLRETDWCCEDLFLKGFCVTFLFLEREGFYAGLLNMGFLLEFF